MEDLLELYSRTMELCACQGVSPAPLAQLALTPKWAVVGGQGAQWGLAFRFGGDHAVHGRLDFAPLLSAMAPFVGRPLSRLVEFLLGRTGLEARIFCLAALNALSAPLNTAAALAGRGWEPLPPRSLPFLRPEDRVVCVGYGCLIDEVLAVCPRVHVCDMRPVEDLETRFVGGERDRGPRGVVFHPARDNPALLAEADVVLLTGCTLANGTWRALLEWAKGARVVGLFGPSAGLSPEVLRGVGFRYVTASRVLDPAALARNLDLPLTDPLHGGCAQGYSLLL